MRGYLIVSIVLTIFVTIQNEVAAKSSLRIVNGTTAEEGEFPYAVQLFSIWGYFACGGSIIGPNWILTAGHCVNEIFTVIYGKNQLDDGSFSTNSIKVRDVFRHPKYVESSAGIPHYDVGLLQLAEPIPFSTNVQPIQLAEDDDIPFHVQGVLSGWGYNSTGGPRAMTDLQKIYLQLLTDQECTTKINDYSGSNSFNATHNLCSDDYWNGECYGDSGSPYVINGTQYGVVSWSFKPCGIVPGTYSRITNPEYRDWIRNITSI